MAEKRRKRLAEPDSRLDLILLGGDRYGPASEENATGPKGNSTLKHPVARPENPERLDEAAFLASLKAGVSNCARPTPLARRLGVNESSLLRVLTSARGLVRRGWCQGVAWCDEEGKSSPAEVEAFTRFSLVGALRTAGEGALVGEYAVRHVREVLGEFHLGAWNDNPVRTQGEVLALLDRAVVAAGGQSRRVGGPYVSHGVAL